MSYTQFKVTWFKKTSVTGEAPAWEAVGTDITDLIQIKEDEALSTGKTVKQDTFEFTVLNTDSGGDGFGDLTNDYQNEDLIQIKFDRDGAGFVTVMDGMINELSYKVTPDGRFVKIKGMNRTKSLLKAIFNLNVEAKKPPQVVAAILAEVNEFNETAGVNNKIDYVFYDEGDITAFADAGGGQVTVTSAAHGLPNSATVDITGTTNYNGQFTTSNVTTNTFEITDTWVADDGTGQWGSYVDQDNAASSAANLTIQRQQGNLATQQAGTSETEFDKINRFASWFDNAYTQIQKMSSFEITNDGNYVFYVDSTNKFYWLAKTTSVVSTLSEGTDFLNAKIVKDVDGVINFFIVHCGTGPLNYGILTFASNDASIAEHGLSGKFLDRTYLADLVMKNERDANDGSFTDSSWPFPSSYNYTMDFQARKAYTVGGTWYAPNGDDGNGGTSEADAKLSIVTTSNADYNEAIVKECKARAESEGSALLDILGVASWKVFMTVKGSSSFSKGDLHTISIPSIGWDGADTKDLRLVEIQHDYDRKGWFTTLRFRQDEEAAL